MSGSGDIHDPTLATPTQRVEWYCPSCDRSFAPDVQMCPDDGTRLVRLAQETDQLIGRVLDGRFTIQKRLGSGGMGAVYKALQHSVGREVAVKVIDPRLSSNLVVAKRFLREAKLASRISQANTVTVLDFGQSEGLLYLVMELLRGRTLDDVLQADGVFSVARAARIGMQVCAALASAHTQGIIHRDLKPSNIMVLDSPAGEDPIKVLDLGLAKSIAGDDTNTTMTRSDMLLGTPSYMPPELALGRDADTRADLYSLGVILYELMTGRLPFTAKTVSALLAQQAYDQPPPLGAGFSPKVQQVVTRCLRKNPADRYPSASALSNALGALAGGHDTLEDSVQLSKTRPHPQAMAETLASAQMVGPVSPAPASARPARGSTWRVLGPVLGVLVLAGAVAGYMVWGRRPAASLQTTPDASASADADAAPVGAAPPMTHPDANVPAVDAGPRTVTVTVHTRPESARVTVNGRPCARPCRLTVPVGEKLRIVSRADGYERDQTDMVARDDGTVEIKLARKRRHTPGTPDEDFLPAGD